MAWRSPLLFADDLRHAHKLAAIAHRSIAAAQRNPNPAARRSLLLEAMCAVDDVLAIAEAALDVDAEPDLAMMEAAV